MRPVPAVAAGRRCSRQQPFEVLLRIPHALEQLVDMGVVEYIEARLRSGKEADIYLVRSRGELRVAKIYKSSIARSFQHRADYLEGRFLGHGRDLRAVKRGTRHGKRVVEHLWRFAEAETLGRLHRAGVRVPEPHDFVDGILMMDLIRDADGEPAPRLKEAHLSPQQAKDLAGILLGQIVRMLDAGVIHGDLSEYNILLGVDGPVIIDFPQSVGVGASVHAEHLLKRDVNNVVSFLAARAGLAARSNVGERLWQTWSRRHVVADAELVVWAMPGSQSPAATS
jgi:RIO kinase 1